MARKNINNIRYADDTIQMAESEEKSNSLLKLKEESEKAGLKLNIKKKKKKQDHGICYHRFMANIWGKNGK